jgi:hypothetical protein
MNHEHGDYTIDLQQKITLTSKSKLIKLLSIISQ